MEPPTPKPLRPMKGLMYSHTISLAGVTSKIRPGAPSQISVLPFGSRFRPADVVAVEGYGRVAPVFPGNLIRLRIHLNHP